MMGVIEYFSSYQEEQMDFQITMGNKIKCNSVERGTIEFQSETGTNTSATNVLHVLGLGMSLILVSQLQDKGYNVHFVGKKVYVKHSSWKKVRQIGARSNRLYRLQIDSPMTLIGNDNINGKTLNELWHRRMGHLPHEALRMLKETVTGVRVVNIEHHDVCRGCVLGKYDKASFPRSNSKAKGELGLIHSDICDPMSTKALSGSEYFVTFIDDHSRKTWIYFLKTKDEVFDRFREFKALIENATGKKIKVLRSNNGGEYIIETS